MSRYIDVDALPELQSCDFTTYEDYCKAFDWVDYAPTVDAVLVVRCKDCTHYRSIDKWCSINACREIYEVDDFCSYGERKDE